MSHIIEFISGEKLIVTILNDNDLELTVQDPFVIIPANQVDAKTQQQQFGVIPWPYFRQANQKIFNIRKSAMITYYIANDELDRYYQSQRSSLVLPPITQVPQPASLLVS